jgi:hypothetical protein
MSRFGVPKTITSIVGRNLLQIFGPSFVKCYTFHIAKLQLIILSPTVRSKDCIAVSRMRFTHAALRRLGPRSYLLYSWASVHSPRKDTGLSQAEAVFGTPIVLPNEILQGDEFSVDAIVKNFLKNLDAPAFSLPRHNFSTQLPAELPDELLRAPFIWLRCGDVIPPLHCPYKGPYAILRHGPCLTIRVGSWDQIVSISHLKAYTEADATPSSPRRHGRPPGKRPGGPAATKWVSLSDPLVSSPSPSQALPSDGPGTVFPVADRFFACPGPAAPSQSPKQRYLHRQRSPPQRLGTLTSPVAGRC